MNKPTDLTPAPNPSTTAGSAALALSLVFDVSSGTLLVVVTGVEALTGRLDDGDAVGVIPDGGGDIVVAFPFWNAAAECALW